MFHHFQYTLKVLAKNKALVFWTFAFPIILGTFFKMAFSGIEENETFQTMDIAVIENEDFLKNEPFKQALVALSQEDSDTALFHTQYVTEEKAKKLLNQEKIIGYLFLEDTTPKVVVKQNGIYETILKNTIDEINTTLSLTTSLVEKELRESPSIAFDPSAYEAIYQKALASISSNQVKLKDTSRKNLSYMMIEFYTLIAMACLYGGVIAMEAMNFILANMTSMGKRTSISPLPKRSIILGSLLASYLIELCGVFLLLAFSYWVLNVNFGSNFFLVLLLSVIASFAGLTLGLIVAIVVKKEENTKVGLIIAISMLCSFFSGMMGVTMKYVIDKNIPLLNQINPANMITDALYALYYYQDLDRYFTNLISLIIFALILLLISIINLRRQKYDNI